MQRENIDRFIASVCEEFGAIRGARAEGAFRPSRKPSAEHIGHVEFDVELDEPAPMQFPVEHGVAGDGDLSAAREYWFDGLLPLLRESPRERGALLAFLKSRVVDENTFDGFQGVETYARAAGAEAEPLLLELLRNTEHYSVRNSCAIRLAELRSREGMQALLEAIDDPAIAGSEGSLVYAVETYGPEFWPDDILLRASRWCHRHLEVQMSAVDIVRAAKEDASPEMQQEAIRLLDGVDWSSLEELEAMFERDDRDDDDQTTG